MDIPAEEEADANTHRGASSSTAESIFENEGEKNAIKEVQYKSDQNDALVSVEAGDRPLDEKNIKIDLHSVLDEILITFSSLETRDNDMNSIKDPLFLAALYDVGGEDEYEKLETEYQNRLESYIRLREKIQLSLREKINSYFEKKILDLEKDRSQRVQALVDENMKHRELHEMIDQDIEANGLNRKDLVVDSRDRDAEELKSQFYIQSLVHECAAEFVGSCMHTSFDSIVSLFAPKHSGLIKAQGPAHKFPVQSHGPNLKWICQSVYKRSLFDAIKGVEGVISSNGKRKQDAIIEEKLTIRRMEAQKRVLEHKKHLKLLKEQEEETRKQQLLQNENRRKKKALDYAQKEMSLTISKSLELSVPKQKITTLAPLSDLKMRSKALKYIQSSSNHNSIAMDLYSSVAYLAYSVEADGSGSIGQNSRGSLSPNKYEKDDQIWILKQDSSGSIIGSRVVPVKDMMDRERTQKELDDDRELKLKEQGWDGPSAGRFLPKISQQAAARALQMKDFERQSSRNVSPSGLRDRPCSVPPLLVELNVDDKIRLSREGRIRRTGEGNEEAKDLILHIKKKLGKGKVKGKLKLSAVEKRLLDSPFSDSFHGKSRSGSRAAHLRPRNSEKLYRNDELENEDEFYGMIPPLQLFQKNEKIISDQREFFELARTVLDS